MDDIPFAGDGCDSDEYQCPSDRSCIDEDRVCDGYPDCPDSEDEYDNNCEPRE